MTKEPSDEDCIRAELVGQLRESMTRSRAMMLNEKLDVKTRERWTQMHTNTAQVLNQILKDQQFKEWENRLRELESRGYVPKGTVGRSGYDEHQGMEDAGSSDHNQGPAAVEGA